MLVMQQDGDGWKCVGRCDGPRITHWLGNTMKWMAMPTADLDKLKDFLLPGTQTPDKVLTGTIYTIRNDIKRPGIDTMPVCAITLDLDQDPSHLPGWQTLDQMEAL